MPSKQKSYCMETGCKAFAEIGGRCKEHYKATRRPKKKPDHKSWYSNAPWKTLRRKWLQSNPLCVECKRQGIITPADTVDHIRPHKGNWELFMDTENLQSLCKQCHDKKTVKSDGGFGRAVDTSQ